MSSLVLSPDEVLSTLVLVIPGFVALAIARYCWGTSRQLETFPLTVWSIFLSAVIDFAFLRISGLPLPPTSEMLVSSLGSWEGLAVYVVITLVMGLAGGFFLRFDAARLLRSLVWRKAPSMLTPNLIWDDLLSIHLYQSILVQLENEALIQGYLDRFSTFDEPREIVLERPRNVVYDDEGKPNYYDLGSSMVIPEKRIMSLRFLQPSAHVADRPKLRERLHQGISGLGIRKQRPKKPIPRSP